MAADGLADAVALGDCGAVTQMAGEEPALWLGRAWCAARSDPPDLAMLDKAVAATEGVQGEYVRLLVARATVGSDPARAVTALLGLGLPGAAGREVELLRARALIEQGKSLDARPGLRALLSTEVGLQARYWLAQGGARRGDTDAAVRTFQRVWIDGTRGGWSERAAERLGELGHPVPDASTDAGRAQVKERIGVLAKANLHAEALALYPLLGIPTTPIALYRARDYGAAFDAYKAVLGAPGSAIGEPATLYRYGLAAIRGHGDYAAAAQIYQRIAELHPTSSEADLVGFKLGYIAYDQGDCASARPHFEAYAKSWPKGRHLDEALWFDAWCAYTSGDTDAAVVRWQRLQTERSSSSLVAGAAYWTARAKGGAEERAGLAAVLTRWPVSGYAWMAAERLGREFKRQPEAVRPAWPEGWGSKREVLRSEALAEAGLDEWAADELAPLRSAASGAGQEVAVAAAWAFLEVGAYKTGKKLASKYCPDPWRSGDPRAKSACTPRPESSVVERFAAPHGLNALLPYAVMTAESALDPGVTSIAGARGLMQLMPAEQARVHQAAFGEGSPHPDDLYMAPYNAAMGTTELGMKAVELQGLLQGSDLPAVIASYNGGVSAVRRWRAAYDEPPPFDVYVESIGYTETRRYVKRVLGFLMRYRWVYGDPG
jgi:soluble lytic murein transglycosylase-like protein